MQKMDFSEFEAHHKVCDARGGFWIQADGTTVPVLSSAGHSETLERLNNDDNTAPETYSEAYGKGWIRVSLCDSCEFDVDMNQDQVTDKAITTLRSLLSHFAKRPTDAGRTMVILEFWKTKELKRWDGVGTFTDYMSDPNVERFRLGTFDGEGKHYESAVSYLGRWMRERQAQRKADANVPLQQAA